MNSIEVQIFYRVREGMKNIQVLLSLVYKDLLCPKAYGVLQVISLGL